MVRQRRALGEAGRARGVLDVDRVVRGQARCTLGQRLRGDRRPAGQQGVPVGCPEQHDVLQGRAAAAHLADHRPVVTGAEALGGDEHPAAGLLQDEGQLVRAVGRVDRDQDHPRARRGVLHQGPLRAVRRPDAQPVAGLQTQAEQPAGHLVDGGVELRPGPAPPGGALHQRLPVGVQTRGAAEVGPDGAADQRRGRGAGGVRDVGGGGVGGHTPSRRGRDPPGQARALTRWTARCGTTPSAAAPAGRLHGEPGPAAVEVERGDLVAEGRAAGHPPVQRRGGDAGSAGQAPQQPSAGT